MMATVRGSGVIELRRQHAHQPYVVETAVLEHGVPLDAFVSETDRFEEGARPLVETEDVHVNAVQIERTECTSEHVADGGRSAAAASVGRRPDVQPQLSLAAALVDPHQPDQAER